MHARALTLALRLLTLACAGAALGSLTACPIFFDCPEPWSDPTSLALGTEVDLIAVGPGLDYDDVVALGLGGLISSFDGETATTQSPVNVALRAVTRREGRLIVVGDQGSIVVSDDGGQTWAARSSGTMTSLIAVSRATLGGVDYLVAAGVEAIVVSADGGETWLPVVAPANGWGTLRGLFTTTERIYAVGDAGVAWSSAAPDGLWTAEALGSTADLLGGGSTYAAADAAVSESETLVVPAADNTLLIRDANGWTSRALELEGSAIAFSAGYLLTSSGAVYDLDGTGVATRVPLELDFEASAIFGDAGGVVVVGKGGAAARIYNQVCIGGRPLVDAGEARRADAIERADWLTDASAAARGGSGSGDRWLDAGLDEHASIASFAVHVHELVSLGAPAELVAAASAAMLDEVRHATGCFQLAARGAAPRGPAALQVSSRVLERCGDARAIALALLEQGCVNETLAACEAAVEAQTCDDPEAARVLATIAEDEARHAALAWRTLAWLVAERPDLAPLLRRRLARVSARSGSAIAQQTLRALIVPLALRVLAGPGERLAPTRV